MAKDRNYGQRKAWKKKAAKRKGKKRKKRSWGGVAWQENYEKLRLVLGSVIESQGGEIRVPKAVCEQYDVTQILDVRDDEEAGEYVLTLVKPASDKPMTIEESQKAYDDAEPAEISNGEVDDLVEEATKDA